MELLLDPAFFLVDHDTLKFWRTTTDNLMTHERNAFKELITKIASLGQSNISIFSSKELEQEQRALLLKRLAWVIFCSDVDQYRGQIVYPNVFGLFQYRRKYRQQCFYVSE